MDSININNTMHEKNLLNFLDKNVIQKTHVSTLMHFLDKTAHLFFLKIESLRSENVNFNYKEINYELSNL